MVKGIRKRSKKEVVIYLIFFYILFLCNFVYAETYHVSMIGSDTTPCVNATSFETSVKTINRGIECLSSGDTLLIHTGEYSEMLVGGVSNLGPIRNVQPNTYNIPNGVASKKTIIKAAPNSVVWLNPSVTYPGGGGVVTTLPPTQHINFEGINADGLNIHSSTLNLKGTFIVYTQAEIKNAYALGIASQIDSSDIILSYLHVHHNGTMNTTSSPAPHAMYICGERKIIEHNIVHDSPNRGIQYSCESGGTGDSIIRHNLIYNVNVGIQLQGANNHTHDNVIVAPGIGIWVGGGSGGLINNNTIYQWRPVISDTYGILAGSTSGPLIRDNIVFKQRVISSSSFNRYIHYVNSIPQMSGNMFDIDPVGGINPAFVEPNESLVFVDAPNGDFRLASNSPARGVGFNGADLGARIEDPIQMLFPVTNLRLLFD